MYWDPFLYASILAFVAVIVLGCWLRKRYPARARAFSGLNALLVASFLSGIILAAPFCFTGVNGWEGFLNSIHAVLQMFSLDGDLDAIQKTLHCSSDVVLQIYRWYGALLYTLAPILTVSFVLSLFENINTWMRLKLNYFRKIYIFSELNEKTLTLARSCSSQNSACLIVFANVQEDNTLQDEASALRPLITRNSANSPLFLSHSPNADRVFFALGEKEDENLQLSLELIEMYRSFPKTSLYCFATSQESELLIGSAMGNQVAMTIRRVNATQALIYRYMYENNLFSNAIEQSDGTKLISIAILGLGQFGTEFLKAAVWCGQLPGYRIALHVFEKDPQAKARFSGQCPELMEMNHNTIDGEAHYDIFFHSAGETPGVDVRSDAFNQLLKENGPYTMAVVSMGSDAVNLETAVLLRRSFLLNQPGIEPIIAAVVFQPNKAKTLRTSGLTDFKGNDYQVQIIGDLESVYSYESVVRDDLEQKALTRHLAWTDKADASAVATDTRKFFQYEYFRRSSIASVIRKKIRIDLGVPGLDKPVSERTDEERLAIQRIEHAGWNAYMRTEGFRYAPKRNDMARLHHLLIPFDDLPESEKLKDDD